MGFFLTLLNLNPSVLHSIIKSLDAPTDTWTNLGGCTLVLTIDW